jgi:hypothetical protein
VVKVKKGRLGRKSREIEAKLRRRLYELPVALVEVEFIMPFEAAVVAHGTDINIEQAVGIDIGHGHAGFPVGLSLDACLDRHVFKLPVASVEVEFVAPLIGRKKQVGQAIIVDIAGSYASSIVKIEIIYNTQAVGILDLVDKLDARFRAGEFFKKCWSIGFFVTAAQTNGSNQQQKN